MAGLKRPHAAICAEIDEGVLEFEKDPACEWFKNRGLHCNVQFRKRTHFRIYVFVCGADTHSVYNMNFTTSIITLMVLMIASVQGTTLNINRCIKNRATYRNPNRIPEYLKIMTCKNISQCHEIRAAIAVGYKNNTAIQIMDLVVACQKRSPCNGGKNIKVYLDFDVRRTPQTLKIVKCPDTTEERFMKIPVFYKYSFGKTGLVYQKVVYDCRCKC